jgi:gamma-glutamyl:cysteine ligase YbdK (ATP-grasp superfamily)
MAKMTVSKFENEYQAVRYGTFDEFLISYSGNLIKMRDKYMSDYRRKNEL